MNNNRLTWTGRAFGRRIDRLRNIRHRPPFRADSGRPSREEGGRGVRQKQTKSPGRCRAGSSCSYSIKLYDQRKELRHQKRSKNYWRTQTSVVRLGRLGESERMFSGFFWSYKGLASQCLMFILPDREWRERRMWRHAQWCGWRQCLVRETGSEWARPCTGDPSL